MKWQCSRCKTMFESTNEEHTDEDCISALVIHTENAERELAELRERAQDVCHWKLTDDESSLWESDCDLVWSFPDGGFPEENEMNYCPKCGRKLEQLPPQEAQ